MTYETSKRNLKLDTVKSLMNTPQANTAHKFLLSSLSGSAVAYKQKNNKNMKYFNNYFLLQSYVK